MKLCAAASTQHRKRKLHKNKLPLATGLYKPAAIFVKLDPFLEHSLEHIAPVYVDRLS